MYNLHMNKKKQKKPWKIEYLEALSFCNTPLMIINKLGISYNQLQHAREDEEFKEQEYVARQLYQERLYSDLESKVKDNPSLLLKFSEKVIDSLKDQPKNIEINTGDKNVTILGITSDQAYEDTQRLLESISKNKSLPGDAK